jgi:CDP-diacylglycerol---serine O-phosphatidyltransferase
VLSSKSDGSPVKPNKHIIGLPTPPSAGVLISLLLANHAMGGALSDERYTVTLFAVTIGVSLLMVSNVRFRSFKDLRFNVSTALLVMSAIGSSAIVWRYTKPQFVLVWLLSFYVLIGVVEAIRGFPAWLRRPRGGEATPEAGSGLEQG